MRWMVLSLLLLLMVAGSVPRVQAHGVELGYSVNTTMIEADVAMEDDDERPMTLEAVQILIEGKFESGDPMSEGQVTVYSPDDPANPWLSGACNEEGHFAFVPDMSKRGIWEVQVREAGHGGWLRIDVQGSLLDAEVEVSSEGGFHTSQIVLMAGSVVWGFIGTGLFVMGLRKQEES